MVNTNKIKARMTELNLNQTEVAARIGIAQSTLNQKINNSRPMFLEEVEILQDLLQIDNEHFGEYFFYHGVA